VADDQPVNQPAQRTEREAITDRVGHLHSAIDAPEGVSVMPLGVGAGELLVGKVGIVAVLRDPRPPADRDAVKHYAIFDLGALPNFPVGSADDREAQPGRGESGQVARVLEEREHLREVVPEEGSAAEFVAHRRSA